MTRHWQIRRRFQPTADGARRWDQAYRSLLPWTTPTEPSAVPAPSLTRQMAGPVRPPHPPRVDYLCPGACAWGPLAPPGTPSPQRSTAERPGESHQSARAPDGGLFAGCDPISRVPTTAPRIQTEATGLDHPREAIGSAGRPTRCPHRDGAVPRSLLPAGPGRVSQRHVGPEADFGGALD
jgi:hypothetical protein